MKSNNKIKFLVVSCIVFSCLYTDAQPADPGYWINYNLRLNFSKKMGTNIDLQFRNYEFLENLEQKLARAFIFYNISEQQVQLSAGACWSHTEQYKEGSKLKKIAEERRLHQQMLLHSTIGFASLTHRYRLEERFFADHSNLRFRYQLNLQIPLNKKNFDKGTLYLILMNEIFLNDVSPVFDRNRALISAGYVLLPTLRIETGMLWQMYEDSHKKQILFSINQTINFHKDD